MFLSPHMIMILMLSIQELWQIDNIYIKSKSILQLDIITLKCYKVKKVNGDYFNQLKNKYKQK